MANQQWEDSTSIITVLSGGLVSLATGARDISSAIDNGTDLDLFGDLEFIVQWDSVAPSAGDRVADLYLLPSIDDINFPEGSASLTPQASLLIGSFESRNPSISDVEHLVLPGVTLHPRNMKFLLINTSGQTFEPSGNMLLLKPYKIQSV